MNTILIGGSSGVGREIAYVLAKEGHEILFASRDIKELELLQSDLYVRFNAKSYFEVLDLSSITSIQNFLKRVYDIFSSIDCLLITAGTIPNKNLDYYDNDALIKTVMVNFTGTAYIINELSKTMQKRGSGNIICVSSLAGERGRKNNFIYGSSKSALTTYLEGLRDKLYSNNINVTTILLGWVDTPMSYGLVNKRFASSPDKVAKKICSLINKKRNRVYIPSIWKYIMIVVKVIPASIFRRLNI